MLRFIHSRKSTQNTRKRGGQNGEYSVKGGFSAENPPFYSLLGGLARQYHNTLSPNILFFGLRWVFFYVPQISLFYVPQISQMYTDIRPVWCLMKVTQISQIYADIAVTCNDYPPVSKILFTLHRSGVSCCVWVALMGWRARSPLHHSSPTLHLENLCHLIDRKVDHPFKIRA